MICPKILTSLTHSYYRHPIHREVIVTPPTIHREVIVTPHPPYTGKSLLPHPPYTGKSLLPPPAIHREVIVTPTHLTQGSHCYPHPPYTGKYHCYSTHHTGKPLFAGSSTINQIDKIMCCIAPPSRHDVQSIQSPYATSILSQVGRR